MFNADWYSTYNHKKDKKDCINTASKIVVYIISTSQKIKL